MSPTTGWTLDLPLCLMGILAKLPPPQSYPLPPRNHRPYFSGLLYNHWFPLIRPKIHPGYSLGGGGSLALGGGSLGFPWLFLGPFLWGIFSCPYTSASYQKTWKKTCRIRKHTFRTVYKKYIYIHIIHTISISANNFFVETNINCCN